MTTATATSDEVRATEAVPAIAADLGSEWLEVDGLGGFASGTVCGIRTRRYHALLLCATAPPTGRMVLVNGAEVSVETSRGTFALSSHYYAPGVDHPDGRSRIRAFSIDPWPSWLFRLEDGTEIRQEMFVAAERAAVVLNWSLVRRGDRQAGAEPVRLRFRPLLSGRDYHALHHENASFRFDAALDADRVHWKPYADVPGVTAITNGTYDHSPDWYRNFLYLEEQHRGLDCAEDLAAPGTFTFDLGEKPAVCILAAEGLAAESASRDGEGAAAAAARLARGERRRRGDGGLDRAADAYLVRRGNGKTIVAGYPWFTDWGRDTFIALRGICLARDRFADARDILIAWASAISEGMLPNRFPDRGEQPEYNSVDASLWYVIAIHDLLAAAAEAGFRITTRDRAILRDAVEAILDGYWRGTRFGIRADDDGLLAAGSDGVQLTWMDAKVGDWVVTPRRGKPVEVQALWLNALAAASQWSGRWKEPFEHGRVQLARRFWNAETQCLFDVVDVDGVAGSDDASVRPNQIFAVGGLPLSLIDGRRARQVVDVVEKRLWTPLGLRSLSPDDPAYVGTYRGGVRERDGAYHQGTVWPWLLDPFVDAWVRVRGGSTTARRQARKKFLQPLQAHLRTSGLGHVSEVADGDAPHRPGGCPFQAWSIAAALRLERSLG